jgi:Fe-S cluster assembly ATPase SufC
VHVLVRGRIVESGGSELVDQLEAAGYAAFTDEPVEEAAPAASADPFADPLA